MTLNRRRILALALMLSLFFSLWPSAAPQSAALAESLGIVTSSSVHVRKQSSTSAEIWFDLSQNTVCTILGETDAEGIHWYKVETTHPDNRSTATTNTYIGFIHGNFFRPLTEEEAASYSHGSEIFVSSGSGSSATVITNTDTAAASGTVGVVTNGGTNFREGPSMKSRSMMKLDRGTTVEILTSPSVISSETFYEVRYNGLVGYIMSTFIRVDGSAVITSVPTATPTPASGGSGSAATATATPTPAVTAAAYTHVRLILSSCHLRVAPAGSYDSSRDWEGRGSILPLAGDPVRQGNYTWYPVWKDNTVFYVRNDCVQPFTDSTVTPTPAPDSGATATPTPDASVTATPTPSPTPTATSSVQALGYVRTTKGGCNLRASIGGTVIKQIKKNVTLPYLLPPVTKNGYTWYFVDADGNRGYLRGDVVKIVNVETPTPTPAPTPSDGSVTAAPTATDNATGYVKTTAGGVNLRAQAGYTDVLGQVDRDVVLPYYGAPTTVKGVIWYYVRHPSLGYGYLHGSYLALVHSDGTLVPTPTPIAVNTPTGGSSSSSRQEASYTTLKLGSTGASVRNLIQELKNQGYYNGSVTTRYTSSVERAVEAFQRAKGLAVDGVAGSATQHALYGTVPVGTADTTNLTMTIYPAEKIDWYTGGINELWPRGSNYKVFDVKTGVVWWAHRWAGGKHVDAEPLTAADTARLCKIYGVSTSDEIARKDLYQRRPMLVTIGTRTFACSLYGVPHNYPEGDTISDNDFKGQLCIHFTNSRIHNSNKVDSDHEAAIEYAWENAPNGHI